MRVKILEPMELGPDGKVTAYVTKAEFLLRRGEVGDHSFEKDMRAGRIEVDMEQEEIRIYCGSLCWRRQP